MGEGCGVCGCSVPAGQAMRILKSLRVVAGGAEWARVPGKPNPLSTLKPSCTQRETAEVGGKGGKGMTIF